MVQKPINAISISGFHTLMNILFVHQNFPGQFRHIAHQLAKLPDNQVVAICQLHAPQLEGIRCLTYKPARAPARGVHPYLVSTESHILNGQAVARVLLSIKKDGFRPDIVIAHTAWGEALYVKDIFPGVPLVGFFEFYYHARGADVGFDPEYPLDLDGALRLRTRNATHLLSLDTVDRGITPTRWQHSVFPPEYQSKLDIIHEGIDTERTRRQAVAGLKLPDGATLSAETSVVTYIARNLEPYRGFHMFMRAVEIVCAQNPDVHIVILGGDEVSYGTRLPNGQTYRQRMLDEVRIDPLRVHFLGRVPYDEYLNFLWLSKVHVYLTVPFVLSWSMLEAMSAECLIIGSDTPPVKEVIEHDNSGLLVDFFSPKEIAQTILSVLNRPRDFDALRAKARQTVLDRYTLAQGVGRYRALIERLMAPAKTALVPSRRG
jgi:glycosyltransferase involved in cell wall biosynthesis